MRRRQLPDTRLSRGYFQSTDRPRPELAGKSFMLWRDLQTGMMRFAGGRGGVRVSLEPNDQRLEEWVVALIDIGQFERGSLAEAVPAFVEQVANHLGYDGEGFFEIVSEDEGPDDGHDAERDGDNDDGARDDGEEDGNDVHDDRSHEDDGGAERQEQRSDVPPASVLAPLPSGKVKRRGGKFLQVLPPEDRRPGEPEALRIPVSRMWHVKLPSELGTPKAYRRMLIELAQREPLASFALEDGRLGANQGYEFSVHRRASDIAVERATRAWGTIPSLQRIAGATEHYYVARRLQFLRSQALVREHVVAELNRLLNRQGVSAAVRVDGLPTAAEISDHMTKLSRGEVSFTAALQACRGY